MKSDHVSKPRRGGVVARGRGRGKGAGRGAAGDTPCFHFSRYGTCPRGSSCRYSHVRRQSTAVSRVEADFLLKHWELEKAHGGAITAMAQSEEGIFTVSQDKTLKRWKPVPKDNEPNMFMLKPDLEVPLPESCCSILYKGGWIFCGLWDGTICGFSKDGGQVVLKGHTKKVTCLLVHESVLMSGSADQEVRLWQMDPASKAWNCTHTIKDSTPGAVHKLQVLGTNLVIGGSNGVAMCSLQTLQVSKLLPPIKFVADFLEFQGHLVAAYADGGLRVFDAEGTLKSELQATHTAGPIMAMGGLASGPRIVCTHSRGQVSTIVLPNFEFKLQFQAFDAGRIESVHCEQSGSQGLFLLGHQNGTLQLWQRIPPAGAA